MFTFSKEEEIESLRKVACIDTLPGPVRVGWNDTVRSFFEYATTEATLAKYNLENTIGLSSRLSRLCRSTEETVEICHSTRLYSRQRRRNRSS